MTTPVALDVDGLRRFAETLPAHALFGVRSKHPVEGEFPSTHQMLLGPELLDSSGQLDLGVLGIVADPACAGAVANQCPPGMLPVTRALRLESVRAPRHDELPTMVVATAETAWRVQDDALVARGSVRTEQGDPLALMTFLGVALPFGASPIEDDRWEPEPDPPAFRVGELTGDGSLWLTQVATGSGCGSLGGNLHGGVAVMLASRVASQVRWAEAGRSTTPLDLTVDFVRPIPTGVDITAVAGLVRGSRRFPRVEGAFYIADRVVLRFASTAIRAQEERE